MSLINDMLKDLDRRGAGNEVPREPDSHRAETPGQIRSRWPLWAVPVVAVVGLSAWLLSTQAPESSRESVESTPGQGDAATAGPAPSEPDSQSAPQEQGPEPESQQQSPEPAPVAEALTAPETGVPGRANAGPESGMETARTTEAERERIESLLEQARRARERDRLTRPAGDNAFEYYQQVLVLAPEHAGARAGLAAIAQRYRELAESALDRDNAIMARRFLNRARSVRPELPGIEATERRLEQLEGNESAPEQTAETGGNDNADEESASSGSEQVAVRRDPGTLDRRRASRAEAMRDRGQGEDALALLRRTLDDWPASQTPPFESAALLAEMQLERNEPQGARGTLERFSDWPVALRTRLEAQLALHDGQPDRALALLEREAGQARDDARYRALLARLYYTEGRLEPAAEQYRALLRDFGNQPAYWLGLGLARDQLDQRRPALEALRRALGSGAYDDQPSVRRYLEERVRALASQLETGEG